jgi:hypothetical protein
VGKHPLKLRSIRLLAIALNGAFNRHSGALCVMLTALLVASVRIVRGTSCGHDFDFHLISWLEVQRAWQQGIPYPHWAQSPNWGAGEARFVFYPPLTWMVGAALGTILAWDWVPAVLTFLCLLGAGLATRKLARGFLPAPAATLAGCLAACAPYALFTAFERTAFGELAAAGWVPLMLSFMLPRRAEAPAQVSARAGQGSPPGALSIRRAGLRFWTRIGTRSSSPQPVAVVPVALALAGAWLTNAPAGVMCSYVLAFVAILLAALDRSFFPLLRAMAAAALGLGLSASYLVPAAWEQRWIAIQQAVDVGMRVSDSWLFAHHAGADFELHDQVLRLASILVVFTAVMAFGGLLVALRGRVLPRSRTTSLPLAVWLPLALLIPAIVVLQFPVSAPVWTLLPKLAFLQFPWRWLMVLSVPYSIFLAAATPLATPRTRLWSTLSWSAAMLALTISGALVFFQFCDAEDKVDNQLANFQAGAGVAGTDEYAALGSDNTLVASGLPDACLVNDPAQVLGESDAGTEDPVAPVWFPEQGSCDDTFQARIWRNEYKLLDLDSDHAGFVILRLRRYPAWRITLDGKSVPAALDREDGLIAVPVPEGQSTLEVRWQTTPDVWWGREISLAALALLAAVWGIERTGRRRRFLRLS